MNTTKKGNLFEQKSLEIIEKLINEERLGFLKEYIKLYTKEKRYSELRKGDVEFDIIIELWPPGAKKYSIIYFIECKDYKIRIPVDKVQKFHSDILQVSGVNAKGIFISNAPFQKGAYNFAESVGMMVIQGESATDFEIILHKRNGTTEKKIQLIKNTKDEKLIDLGIESLEKIVDKQILKSFINNKNSISYNIDLLSKIEIEQIANIELNKIDTNFLKNGYSIDILILTDFLKTNYGIQIEIINSDENLLGSCDIENRTIRLNQSIINTKRHLFVLCHEFGHFILHQKLSINQELYDSFTDSEYNFKTGRNDLKNPRHWIEWQANYFSASFILPKSSILARLWKFQLGIGLQESSLYLDDQKVNQENFRIILTKLSNYFNVSKTSIIFRLKEMNELIDNSRTKSINQIIEEYFSDYFT